MISDEKIEKPRRRIVMRLDVGADDWESLSSTLDHLSRECLREGGLSKSVVSGGYSAGFIMTCDIDETITHDTWADANNKYCEELKRLRAKENGK